MAPLALDLLARLWTASWQAAVVAAVVVAVRLTFGRALTARWRHALWALVLLRLLLPALPQSRLSVFGLADRPGRPSAAAAPVVAPPITATLPAPLIKAGPSTSPDPVPVRPPRWPLPVAALWLTGAAGLLLRLAVVNVRFEQSLRLAPRTADPRLAALFDRCCDEVGRRPTLVVTAAVDAPAACGALQPRVLLPADLAALPDGPLRLVFLHELEHVRRRDVAVDWAWAVATAVHWFNPALWLVGPLRRHDRELARDEAVLSRLGPAGAEAYGRALLDLARPTRAAPLCPGMFGGTRPLRQRVEAVARFRRSRTAAVALGVVVLVVAAVCLLTSPPRPGRILPAAIAPPTTVPAATQFYADHTGYRDPDPPSVATAATAALLDRRLPELRFNANALSDVFDFLRDATGANLYVDWPAPPGGRRPTGHARHGPGCGTSSSARRWSWSSSPSRATRTTISWATRSTPA